MSLDAAQLQSISENFAEGEVLRAERLAVIAEYKARRIASRYFWTWPGGGNVFKIRPGWWEYKGTATVKRMIP